MVASSLQQVLRHLRQVAGSAGDELGDGELLDRFIQQRDEIAFDRLLQRHGRMVLGVCRAFLRDSHEAEDALQATFLVLVRSAHSVRKQSSLNSWLYGVAYRTALKARSAAHRRRREEQIAAMRQLNSSVPPPDNGDDRPILAEELQRLPEKYRAPMLLCYLEGKTTAETARQLGWPQGTVLGRLMRGRDLLRSRLTRRGVTLSAAGLPIILADTMASAVSPSLAQATLRAALLGAAQPLAAGSVSASVAALTQGVLHAMFLTKVKRAAAVVLGLVLLVGAAGLAAYPALAAKDDKAPAAAADSEYKAPQRPLRVEPSPISTDKTVKYDYDIVYVRAPRSVKGSDGKERQAQVWPNAAEPENLRAPTDLMLLHPDGSEEVLVAGAPGAIADPYVSFDAQWVYYSYFHDASGQGGADVYKVHVKTRKTVRLTQQQWTPNTGVADGKTTFPKGVCNMHPCPLPGGRVAFISNRDGFTAPRPRGAQRSLQLFVMDDDGANAEKIGHLNVGQALHPVVLTDGRIIFSSLEMQGKHNTGWGILGIHPDGTNWDPVVSALSLGGAPIPFHFQTQLSDGSIVVENYYIPGMGGFGVYFKQPPRPPAGTPPFGPAKTQNDPKMTMMSRAFLMPFQPYGMEVLTRFTHNHDSPALREDPKDPKSRHTGWVTHPCGAPDNHLLTVWSGMMPANQGRIIENYGHPPVDAGIYLIKGGRSLWEPGDMLLVKNDPKYNEQWPRPLVSYQRIYGVDEPRRLPALRNEGQLSKHLPEGTPFGLVGTSSLYKRESFPLGEVAKGSVTATGALYAAFPTREHRTNWDGQGADAGLYANSDIHAIRILAMEPSSIPVVGRFSNHAGERLRILGEIPVRKFSREFSRDPKGSATASEQPLDPDGNPDTSFLAKIPADVAWTFQTLDKDGLVLNMAQTWHQLRPGEMRNNCGGCHAHSQQPTLFKDTFAARPDYQVFDLTKSTPLLTVKKNDESGKKWDVKDETGLRFANAVLNVEYHRDIKPILERSCVACHTKNAASGGRQPPGNLVLDNDQLKEGRPATYSTLIHAKDNKSAPYVWPSQSRNSLLTWKLFGRRVDGFPEKLVTGPEGGYQGYLNRGGVPWDGFKGSIMPPPEAVAGTYAGPDGQKIKVAPLTDEDRRTIFRWIDLGCPIDLGEGTKNADKRGNGWLLDDQRPTLSLTYPRAGGNTPLTRLLVGMHDYGTGLDMDSFSAVADFPLGGLAAGENLATKFKPLPDSRWELTLAQPITDLPKGKLTVSVKDKQGNTSRIERTFSVGKE